jgi:hypothetical protein
VGVRDSINMSLNPSTNFELNTWYKGLVYFGGIIAVLGIFYPVHVLDSERVVLFGLSIFTFGISTWADGRAYIFDYSGKEVKTPFRMASFLRRISIKTIRFMSAIFVVFLICETIGNYL